MGTLKRAENDFYIEPPEAIEALISAERLPGLSWDPACGTGTIPAAMWRAGLSCIGTDLVDRQQGPGAMGFTTLDFLGDRPLPGNIDNIVSNPPFNLAQPFVDRALTIATHKVAMLLPLTFLEGMRRGRWLTATPLARVHVFSWRISMPPGELLLAGAVRPAGGKKAFAWMVWEQGWQGPAQVRLLFKEAA